MLHVVATPRLNANEDEVEVVEITVEVGQSVAVDDLLCVLESTKTSLEVPSPHAGIVRAIAVTRGQFVTVGAPLCEIEAAGAAGTEASAGSTNTDTVAVQVSAKAKKRAAELGVDIASVTPVGGRIRVEDVEAAASTAAKAPTKPAAAPAVAGRRPLEGHFRAVIVGAGGHAACIIDALRGGEAEILGCVDPARAAGTEVAGGITVIGADERLAELLADGVGVAFIGIGGATENGPRRKVFGRVRDMGFDVPPLVHPRAWAADTATLSDGVQVLAGAMIGARAVVGANTVVNQGANLCHDVTVGADVHVAPGAIVAADVCIGDGTTIGMGATVLNGVTIGAGCLIHNGVSVVGDVPDFTEVDRRGLRRRREQR